VFSVASKLTFLLRRRPIVVLTLTVASAVAGAFGHHGLGFWDGPL
jgi:hypothetical protein